MSRQNNFLDELAALLQEYKVDVSVEERSYDYHTEVSGLNFYSYGKSVEDSIYVTLPASIFHDNLTSTIQSFKE